METINLLSDMSDDEVIEILSDGDIPLQTSTQVPIPQRPPSSKPKQREVQPIILEDTEESGYEAIDLITSSPPKKVVQKKDTRLLDRLMQMTDSEDDDSEINIRPSKSNPKTQQTRSLSPPINHKKPSPPKSYTRPERATAPVSDEAFDLSELSPQRQRTEVSAPVASTGLFTSVKHKPLSKISADELKNLMKALDSSRDSIVESPRNSSHRSPLFVPNSAESPVTSNKPKPKPSKVPSSIALFFEDSDDDAPPGVRAPPQVESIDSDDEDVTISRHDIILSSSPANRFNLDDINHSSSIGELRPSNAPSKPIISHEKLKTFAEPIYKYDKSKETADVSNPFLDKLMNKITEERLEHEELLKRREREARAKANRERELRGAHRSSSPLRYTSKKQPRPSPTGRQDHQKNSSKASTQPNWADYTFSSDDSDNNNNNNDDDDNDAFGLPKFNSAPVRRREPSPPPPPRPQFDPLREPIQRSNKRAGTDSNTATTKESRAIAKATKEKERLETRSYKEANKVNRSKTELLGEMIMDAPKSFMDLIRQKNCEKELEGIQVKEAPKFDSYIHWQRKVTSKYDTDTDSFIPTSPHLLDEKQCCFVFTASEFASNMEMETPLNTFNKFRREHKQFQNFIIVIVEYDQLISKLKNKENKMYADKVRAGMNGNGDAGATEPTKKRRKQQQQQTDSDLSLQEMEEAISQLQINGFKVFPTKNAHDTCLWLRSFTYAIAHSRYDKLERNPDFSNIGAIRSGKGTEDTYAQMLLQLKFMTEPRVKRVTEVVPSLRRLFDHVQRGKLPAGSDGKSIMNRNVESVVMRIFTTRDENELIHD